MARGETSRLAFVACSASTSCPVRSSTLRSLGDRAGSSPLAATLPGGVVGGLGMPAAARARTLRPRRSLPLARRVDDNSGAGGGDLLCADTTRLLAHICTAEVSLINTRLFFLNGTQSYAWVGPLLLIVARASRDRYRLRRGRRLCGTQRARAGTSRRVRGGRLPVWASSGCGVLQVQVAPELVLYQFR